jgi:integrase
VHIRNAKGNKDRLVPLPLKTLKVLRRFWSLHRHPVFLFPNRKRGLDFAHLAESPLDRGGIQVAIKGGGQEMGLKKTFHAILYAIVTPLIYSKRESIY